MILVCCQPDSGLNVALVAIAAVVVRDFGRIPRGSPGGVGRRIVVGDSGMAPVESGVGNGGEETDGEGGEGARYRGGVTWGTVLGESRWDLGETGSDLRGAAFLRPKGRLEFGERARRERN